MIDIFTYNNRFQISIAFSRFSGPFWALIRPNYYKFCLMRITTWLHLEPLNMTQRYLILLMLAMEKECSVQGLSTILKKVHLVHLISKVTKLTTAELDLQEAMIGPWVETLNINKIKIKALRQLVIGISYKIKSSISKQYKLMTHL